MATTLAAAAARRLAAPRLSIQAATLTQRRCLAGSADHHGPPKINCWQDPTNPSQWKEEHLVNVSLCFCALTFYGGYKLFTWGKGKMGEILLPIADSSNSSMTKLDPLYNELDPLDTEQFPELDPLDTERF